MIEMLKWLSYRRNWYLLWLFDLITVGISAFLLYNNPSPFGKNGEVAANVMLYMMLYGLLRAAWLFVLVIVLLLRKNWWMVVLASVHGAAWYLLFYSLAVLISGAVG